MEKVVLRSGNRPTLAIQQTTAFKNSNDYQQDFLYVAELVKDVFPYCERYFDGDFEAEVKRIYQRLERVEEAYIFDYEVKRFLAQLHNNHTYLVSENDAVYPVYIRLFDGDLVIINTGQHLDTTMIGQHIESINNKSAAEWLQHSLDITNGKIPFQDSLSAERAFLYPNFYRFYGSDAQQLTIQTRSGQQFIIEAEAIEDFKWYRWRSGMSEVYRMTQENSRGYDYEILAAEKLAYFQFNTFMDKATMLDGIIQSKRIPVSRSFKPQLMERIKGYYF